MDGTTALKTLRAQGCAVPVVALTACALSNDEVRCNQAGFQDFLSKPYTKSQLLGVCEKWLGPIGKATSHGA
jgi:CheY-like chemotaxis protein